MYVAPRVGAWIETWRGTRLTLLYGVAPRVGAWIETSFSSHASYALKSHPVWVRGLKQGNGKFDFVVREVAPRVGAWIETVGLYLCTWSLCVAPRVGAWIETLFESRNAFVLTVAPRVGAWIETSASADDIHLSDVAPRVGAWIETRPKNLVSFGCLRRTPCGCVD